MSLPAFIDKMTGFSDKAEQHFIAALQTAQARVSELEKENATLKAALAESESDESALAEQLCKSSAQVKTLEASVDTERKRANEVIAAQGLPTDQVPSAAPSTGKPGANAANAWEKYQSLRMQDPRAAGEFWASNANEILASRPQ